MALDTFGNNQTLMWCPLAFRVCVSFSSLKVGKCQSLEQEIPQDTFYHLWEEYPEEILLKEAFKLKDNYHSDEIFVNIIYFIYTLEFTTTLSLPEK